ncbi:hypothetical protein [Calothrix sp. PCC 6303]|uniref:hypothetical protein n=1 Tax=Calothrix sp. PCC 6303 TaxID=1170562 RepID=UPI0002A05213|nr:hypothetical protein [Calothrix sp. PCC 6303]AFZ03155.1 hypothetical protein Cal6303_4246 [Calothrix sp. PCC 6303]
MAKAGEKYLFSVDNAENKIPELSLRLLSVDLRGYGVNRSIEFPRFSLIPRPPIVETAV